MTAAHVVGTLTSTGARVDEGNSGTRCRKGASVPSEAFARIAGRLVGRCRVQGLGGDLFVLL